MLARGKYFYVCSALRKEREKSTLPVSPLSNTVPLSNNFAPIFYFDFDRFISEILDSLNDVARFFFLTNSNFKTTTFRNVVNNNNH